MQSMQSRDRDLGLTDEIYRKCYRIIEKALEKEDQVTREELTLILQRANITINIMKNFKLLLLHCALLCVTQPLWAQEPPDST